MARFEVILNKGTILENNHVKPFEIVEAEGLYQNDFFVLFTIRTPHSNKGLMIPDTVETKVWYNIDSIIKINKLGD